MKLTKYQHACFVVEKDNTTLVIDPGVFTKDFIIPARVDGIVVTHNHPDHLDETLIEKILAKHPKAIIIGPPDALGAFAQQATVVAAAGELYTIGTMEIQFFGEDHAPIDASIQTPANTGVLIDGTIYYPGDSFTIPSVPVKALAVPVAAPWLKISETLSFLKMVKPLVAFPTHDAILSDEGKALVDRLVNTTATAQGTHYQRIDGETIELS